VEPSIRLLRAVQPAFTRLGIKAAVENLPWQSHADGLVDTLLAEFDEKFLGFCFDSGHAFIMKQEHLLEKHIGRLIVTHLHDNDGKADQHLLPGEGIGDWSRIVAVLKDADYPGPINLEIRLPAGHELAPYCRIAYETIERLWHG